MLIFRVCCKLHNFCIQERDPWYDTYGGAPPAAPGGAAATLEPTGYGDDRAARAPRHAAPQKERRHSWMLQLKARGLRRRVRQH